MPLSSVVVAGNPALASQYNNLRIDAMARIETVTAGEAYTATTAVTNAGSNQAYSLPTLLQQDSTTGKWLKMDGDTVGLGARVRIGMAYEASAGDGSSVKIYLPGSLISGLSAMTAEVGRTATCSTTSGAVESTVLPPYYTFIGWWPSATSFMFEGLMFNNVNPKNIAVPVTSGEAFSVRDALYISDIDGKAYKAVNNTSRRAAGWYAKAIASQAATAANQTVQVYPPGSIIYGYSGLTPGAEYYPSSTAGTLVAGTGFKPLYAAGYGYAMSSSVFMFESLEKNDNSVTQSVSAGENWTIGDHLYLKKSDGRYYKVDADVAESGIAEMVAVACATHTGGAASAQTVFFPGSIIFGTIGGTVGDRTYPSGTPGAVVANTPASYDTFYRPMGYFPVGNIYHLLPQEKPFLPTGVQEKGYCAGGSAAGGSAIGDSVMTPINFKNIMVNTPSSLTLTLIDGNEYLTPSIESMNRFGAGFFLSSSTDAGLFWWKGTYQTVGN